MKRSFLLSAILLLSFMHICAASYISFNNVYSVTSKLTSKVTTGTLITGSSFKISSSNSFANAGSAAQALYYVTLEYTNSSGVTLSYPGIIRTDINSGTASQALLFEQTTSLGVQTLTNPEVYFLLVVPTYEASIGSTVQYTLNASYKSSYLPPITTVQDNNAAPVITSNGGGSSAVIDMPGGVSLVTTVTASDQTTQSSSATYLLKKKGALTITGGTEKNSFSLSSTTVSNQTSASGTLSFLSTPFWSMSGNNTYNVQITASDSLGTTDMQNLIINILQPTISITQSLNPFSYYYGEGPSIAQSFNVSGANLYSNLTITVPEDYEVSNSLNGTYTTLLTLNALNSVLSQTALYVRLKAGKAIASNYNGNIAVSATDAELKYIPVTGTVSQKIYTKIDNNDINGVDVTLANGFLCVRNNKCEDIKVSIHTITGSLVSIETFNQSLKIYNNLAKGVYLLSIQNSNRRINQKIVVK